MAVQRPSRRLHRRRLFFYTLTGTEHGSQPSLTTRDRELVSVLEVRIVPGDLNHRPQTPQSVTLPTLSRAVDNPVNRPPRHLDKNTSDCWQPRHFCSYPSQAGLARFTSPSLVFLSPASRTGTVYKPVTCVFIPAKQHWHGVQSRHLCFYPRQSALARLTTPSLVFLSQPSSTGTVYKPVTCVLIPGKPHWHGWQPRHWFSYPRLAPLARWTTPSLVFLSQASSTGTVFTGTQPITVDALTWPVH